MTFLDPSERAHRALGTCREHGRVEERRDYLAKWEAHQNRGCWKNITDREQRESLKRTEVHLQHGFRMGITDLVCKLVCVICPSKMVDYLQPLGGASCAAVAMRTWCCGPFAVTAGPADVAIDLIRRFFWAALKCNAGSRQWTMLPP